jgi:uncharacterized protein
MNMSAQPPDMNYPSKLTPRIQLVDALRGFALMGLFLIHMVEYFELYWYHQEPGLIHDLMFAIFGGKAYAIFALLFGLSFFIIMDNQQRKGINFAGRFCWRLILLGLLGTLHSLLYSGDILQVLALSGFILVLLHRLSNLAILLIATLFLLQLPLLLQITYFELNTGSGMADPLHWALSAHTFEQLAHGSFSQVVINNASWGLAGKWMFFIESGRLWQLIGLFLVGYVLGRNHFFSKQPLHNKCAFWGIGLALVVIMLTIMLNPIFAQMNVTPASKRAVFGMLSSYHDLAILVIELSLFILLYQFKTAKKILDLQAPAGRMSLSMYLLQSIIGAALFYGYGLGLYSSIGQANALLLGLGLWFIQLWLATQYRHYFHYGPFEWLWRACTLMNFRLPIRRQL